MANQTEYKIKETIRRYLLGLPLKETAASKDIEVEYSDDRSVLFITVTSHDVDQTTAKYTFKYNKDSRRVEFSHSIFTYASVIVPFVDIYKVFNTTYYLHKNLNFFVGAEDMFVFFKLA